MLSPFDERIDRTGASSLKWTAYPRDVLPLWVADMDFRAPGPVRRALQAALDHGVFGYEFPPRGLEETVAARMDRLYGWKVSPGWVMPIPGVVAGFHVAARAACSAGGGVLVQPPAYPPFLHVQHNTGTVKQLAPLRASAQGHILKYQIDWPVLEAAFDSGGARTGMFLLCHPHNPTGLVFTRAELERMAEICLRHGATICSDEIHSELLLGGACPERDAGVSPACRADILSAHPEEQQKQRNVEDAGKMPARHADKMSASRGHLPLASLGAEVERRTITLIAPSKTFNTVGLSCAFAIVADEELRKRYRTILEQTPLHVNSMGLVAAKAALGGECDDWLRELLAYLTANRDFVVEFVARELPGVRVTVPDATYLAWMDFSEIVREGRIVGDPYKFFLEHAKVALNQGAHFGPGGELCLRLNFGCPRATLVEAMGRMKRALFGQTVS